MAKKPLPKKKITPAKKTKVIKKKPVQKADPQLIAQVYNQMNTILDPELGVGIVDLGLIYDVKIENKTALITMTLTTMGCPVGPMLIEQIDMILPTIFPEAIEKTLVDIVWDPPWSPEKMKPEIRDLMQGF